jgi:hypothetical protein
VVQEDGAIRRPQFRRCMVELVEPPPGVFVHELGDTVADSARSSR